MTDRMPPPNSSHRDLIDAQVITLTLPLALRHASTARIVAASLAADAGFSVDEIDDLRLGINEVVSVLVDHGSTDPDARLSIEFRVVPGRVEAIATRTDQAGTVEIDDLAQLILDAVTDHYELSADGFSLSKTAAHRDDAD
ncbi:MAG: ATP-binding protein [Actinobacteria bacterium]|nr:ATP-binding protein [Actinomycetota bacterium]